MRSTQSPTIELPDDLRTALERFQRRWRWISMLTLVGFLALIPLCSFALLSLSDRLWDTPQWARWVLAIPVPLLMAAALAPFVKRWGFDRPGPRHLARFMGRLDSRVGDRLLGAVELSTGTGESWSGSPALRQAAIEQVARELRGVKAEDKLDVSLVKKVILGAAVFAILVSAFIGVSPQAAANALQRWLRPYENVERFTFVRFDGFPDQQVVAHGEPFMLEGSVQHVDGQAVSRVDVRSDGPEKISLTREASRLQVEAEGVTLNRTVSLSAGDARERIAIRPLLRPELVGLSATVQWPDYLDQTLSDVMLRRRRLEVPAGSTVQLRAKISRDVQQVIGTEGAELNGPDVILPGVKVLEDTSVEFAWVDSVGLRPQTPARVELIAAMDTPPSVSLSGLPRAVAVLEDEFIELQLSARDDYGLQRVWHEFEEQNQELPAHRVVTDADVTGKTGDAEIGFSPELAGFTAGSQIDVMAMALDAYPERTPSVSARFRILVLSKAEHAKLVLQQMERVLSELDESIRQEALAIEANEATAGRSEEDRMDDSTTETLTDRALDEQARSERLDQTRELLEDLLVEAAKNEEIADTRIAEWAQISEQLKNAATPSMQAAARALQQAAQAQNPASEADVSEREEKLNEALAEQKKALEAMQHGDEDLNESIENSLSESFINRFRHLANVESAIQRHLSELLPQTIGLRTPDLPEELRTTLLQQADAQEQVNRLTRYIYDDLEGFFQRTQQPVLDEITSDMLAENYSERLPALEALIRRNTVGLSTGEAATWTNLYLEWAQKLEEAKNAGASQGQGGGGGEDEEGEDLETMVALIRARERQETLRQQVRSLDEGYETNANFHRDAVMLAERQYELARDLQPLENRVKKPETKQLVSLAAGESMNAGVRLRRPDTGQGTLAVQTEVIERIAAALDQSMGNPPENQQDPGDQQSQQSSSQITQAIMEMMQNRSAQGRMAGAREGEGQTGGGDPGSGRPDGTASGLNGSNPRGQGKAGGLDPSVWPGRYRDMMDAYFEAVEGSP